MNQVFRVRGDIAVVDSIVRHLVILLDDLRIGNGIAWDNDTIIIIVRLRACALPDLSRDRHLFRLSLLIASSIATASSSLSLTRPLTLPLALALPSLTLPLSSLSLSSLPLSLTRILTLTWILALALPLVLALTIVVCTIGRGGEGVSQVLQAL